MSDRRDYPAAPDAFVPARWLAPSAPPPPAAFLAFSAGPANCVGRHLARREMLMLAALLLRRFELRWADGVDGAAWPGTLRDYFVSARGPLLVRLRLRT